MQLGVGMKLTFSYNPVSRVGISISADMAHIDKTNISVSVSITTDIYRPIFVKARISGGISVMTNQIGISVIGKIPPICQPCLSELFGRQGEHGTQNHD